MYAVIKVGGKQYKVEQGQTLLVDRQPHEPGKAFTPSQGGATDAGCSPQARRPPLIQRRMVVGAIRPEDRGIVAPNGSLLDPPS